MSTSPHFKDITGKTFGLLTMQYRVKNNAQGKTRWFCTCVCGGVKEISAANLRDGYVSSCGCSKRKQLSIKMKNFWIKAKQNGQDDDLGQLGHDSTGR